MWAEYKSTLKVSLCFLFFKFYNDTEDKVKFWITKFGEFGHLCFKILWLDFFLLENSWYNLFALCIYTNFHSNQNWLNFSRVKINIQTFVQLLQFTIKAIFLCIYEERESFNIDIFFNLQNWILPYTLYIVILLKTAVMIHYSIIYSFLKNYNY